MSSVFKRLRLRQVDEKLEPWRDIQVGEPKTGWVRTIRDALGMSSSQLANRIGISQQAVIDLEQREAQGSVTLSALRTAAAALDAEVVYAIVPKHTLSEMVRTQAGVRAAGLLGRTAHTMSLEAQGLSADEHRMQLSETTESLIQAWPRTLWDAEDGIEKNHDKSAKSCDRNRA
jgi:predicted DNA-binding mobile mystery protein A